MACGVGKRDDLLTHLERDLLHTQACVLMSGTRLRVNTELALASVSKAIQCRLASASRVHHERPFVFNAMAGKEESG